MKLLVIEPSKLYQQMLGSLFSSLVTTFELVESGSEGLKSLFDTNYDLICIALELQDMNGLEFAERLRQQSSNNCIPLVMISSEKSPELVKRALGAGITEVFHKSDLSVLSHYVSDLSVRTDNDVKLHGNVLYVEDSPSVAALIKHMLVEMGLKVDHVTSGEAALPVFHDRDYQLVITDVILAGDMTGIGLTRTIRHSVGKKSRVPILAISGLDDTARRIELLRSGANDYVAKPLIDEEFRARVKNLVMNQQLMDQVDRQQKRLQQMAMTDQLTSLYNRHYIVEMIPKILSGARRHGFHLSLVVLDLDHFKSINDTYGHAMGDAVLTGVAGLLKSYCRAEDIAARFGGEEFVLVLTHCSLAAACEKAETLRQKIAELNPAGIEVSASFGVASLAAGEHADYDALFHAADKAVYQSKREGRNRVSTAEVQYAESNSNHLICE